jgi:C_GCAxxG_C_C family probable redox protein
MKTDRSQQAVSLFKEGFSCSQAVLGAYSDIFGLERNLALKISQPFGGGIAHRGEMCGAVSGAFMTIGLKLGRTKAEDTPSREKTYEAVKSFIRKFEDLHGSIICRELLGYDIGSADGFAKAEKQGLFETLCPKLVQNAAEILKDMI